MSPPARSHSPRRDPGSGGRPEQRSRSPCRSGDRTPTRETGLPVGVAIAGRQVAVSVPVSHASPCRLHAAGRGRRAARDRRRRPACDLDDRAGAFLGLPAGPLLRGDRGRASRCARRPRVRVVGGERECGPDRGVRRRRVPAGVPRAGGRHADPLDDERHADDPDRGRRGATRSSLGSLLNLGAVAEQRTRARRGRRRSSAPGSRARSRSTTPTAPAGSSRCSAPSARTPRSRRSWIAGVVRRRARGPARAHVRPARARGGHPVLLARERPAGRAALAADDRRRRGDRCA